MNSMNTEKLNEGESPDHVSEESAESEAQVDKGKQGGNRRDAGRKRVHDVGYRSVRNVLWKNISIHSSIFDDWIQERHRHGIKNNSEFAIFLLDNAKNQEGRYVQNRFLSYSSLVY